MIGAWIIEIHGALDEPKSEQSDIKIQIPLRIGRNRSDMMKTADGKAHKAKSYLPILVGIFILAQGGWNAETKDVGDEASANANGPIFHKLSDAKWQ
jgi:hypothetical protein